MRQGEFTGGAGQGDLDLGPVAAAHACNNIDNYDYYYKTAQWMPASGTGGGGGQGRIWYHYRYACAPD